MLNNWRINIHKAQLCRLTVCIVTFDKDTVMYGYQTIPTPSLYSSSMKLIKALNFLETDCGIELWHGLFISD